MITALGGQAARIALQRTGSKLSLGGGMDILVLLEENPEHSPVLAHVSSVPAPLNSERPSRDVVTLYGVASPESLALALAAAVESRRDAFGTSTTIRHLGVWPERGAIGDAAWRDMSTGQLMTRDLDIPLETLGETARALLMECGQLIRRLVAGLSMPDWPEGARRAISFSFSPMVALPLAGAGRVDAILETVRETDGFTFDFEGD
jgi:hypothetical protein